MCVWGEGQEPCRASGAHHAQELGDEDRGLRGVIGQAARRLVPGRPHRPMPRCPGRALALALVSLSSRHLRSRIDSTASAGTGTTSALRRHPGRRRRRGTDKPLSADGAGPAASSVSRGLLPHEKKTQQEPQKDKASAAGGRASGRARRRKSQLAAVVPAGPAHTCRRRRTAATRTGPPSASSCSAGSSGGGVYIGAFLGSNLNVLGTGTGPAAGRSSRPRRP